MKIIITGATGMVGRGVLLECLDHPDVTRVLLVSRSSVGMTHGKLSELLHFDFSSFDAVAHQFEGYDAAFHCMGVTSAGLSEAQYTQLTYGISEAFAKTLYDANPSMTVIYVSGAGTDSSER